MNFEEEWHQTITIQLGEKNISPELRPLIQAVYKAVMAKPTSLAHIKLALEQLLGFLISPSGRTDANCMAVDVFFGFSTSFTWEHLPIEYQAVMVDMGTDLHNTVSNPKFASTRGSLPEQILEKVLKLRVDNNSH